MQGVELSCHVIEFSAIESDDLAKKKKNYHSIGLLRNFFPKLISTIQEVIIFNICTNKGTNNIYTTNHFTYMEGDFYTYNV